METKMKDARKKFADARNLCPGMSDDMYLLTDYMSENTNDELVPMGVMMLVLGVRYDLEKGKNGFAFGKKFPETFTSRKDFLLDEIKWIPQVIDAIADEDFAEAFRKEWYAVFKSMPPKRVNTAEIKVNDSYPEYIKVAVDWWANAIISPKFDNGKALPTFLAFMSAEFTKEYTPEDIKIFKDSLAKSILESVEDHGYCTLSVDYHPCQILEEAGWKIGVDPSTGWPCKTFMRIQETEVCVQAGYTSNLKLIWKMPL